MEKDRDLRYQSAAEIRADLKRLKRDTGSGRHGVSESQRSAPEFRKASGASVAAAVESARRCQHPSGSSAIAYVAKEHKFGTAAIIAIVLAAGHRLGASVCEVSSFTIASKPFAQYSITQATNSGTATLVAPFA